ncbi:hypothetical protein P4C99_12615 [Pontiellaceae bacterium B1224]|nr:hypothetical protein [Pontiellaceae bacterium B1224]
MKNILFICSQNKLRSPTAEQLYSDTPGLEVSSAGLNNDAEVAVTPELLEWSERIFVMERNHRSRLTKKFKSHLQGKRITVLDIPDDYDFMDEVLLMILEQKLTPMIGRPNTETQS